MRRDPSRLVTAASGWDDCEVGHLYLHLFLFMLSPPGGACEGPAHLPWAQRGGAGGEVRLPVSRPGGDVGQGEGRTLAEGDHNSRAWCRGGTAGLEMTGPGVAPRKFCTPCPSPNLQTWLTGSTRLKSMSLR